MTKLNILYKEVGDTVALITELDTINDAVKFLCAEYLVEPQDLLVLDTIKSDFDASEAVLYLATLVPHKVIYKGPLLVAYYYPFSKSMLILYRGTSYLTKLE
jgi:hypothetical protein